MELVDPKSLLWFRIAFDEEWRGAIMIRDGEGRIYSIETIKSLQGKFTGAGVRLATFTAPDKKIDLYVNADNVQDVEAPNEEVNPKARALLRFSRSLWLAVRETEVEANAKIGAPIAKRTAAARNTRAKKSRRRES